jgi:hypothetical protein
MVDRFSSGCPVAGPVAIAVGRVSHPALQMTAAQQNDEEHGSNNRDGDRSETSEAVGEKCEHRRRFIVGDGKRGCS